MPNTTIGQASFSLDIDLKALDKSLKKADKSFEKFLKGVQKDFVKLEKNIQKNFFAKIDKGIKKLENINIKVNTSSVKKVTSEIDKVSSSADTIGSSIQSSLSGIDFSKIESRFKSILSAIKNASKTTAKQIETNLDIPNAGNGIISGFQKAFSKIESAAKSTAKTMASVLGKTIKTGVVAGGAAGAAGAGAGVASATWLANDLDTVTKKVKASMEFVSKNAKNFEDVIVKVYTDNFGDSLSDVGNKFISLDTLLQKQKKQLIHTDGQFVDLFETISTISDIEGWGADFFETGRGMTEVMAQFGLTTKEAAEFLITGFQTGMDVNKDFLDTLSEYSNYFADIGFSAEEMFSLLKTGMGGVGVGVDKVGDLLKEFSNTYHELSTDATKKGALEKLFGKGGANSLIQAIESGQISTKELFLEINNQLASTATKAEKIALGTAIFGTMYEDMGKGRDFMSSTDAQFDRQGKRLERLSTQYNTFGNMVQGVYRTIKTEIAKTGVAIGGETGVGAEKSIANVERLKNAIKSVSEKIRPVAVEKVREVVEWITKKLENFDLEKFVSKTDSIKKTLLTVYGYVKNIINFVSGFFSGKSKSETVLLIRDSIKSIFDIAKNLYPVFGTIYKLGLSFFNIVLNLLAYATSSKIGMLLTITLVIDLLSRGYGIISLIKGLFLSLINPITPIIKLISGLTEIFLPRVGIYLYIIRSKLADIALNILSKLYKWFPLIQGYLVQFAKTYLPTFVSWFKTLWPWIAKIGNFVKVGGVWALGMAAVWAIIQSIVDIWKAFNGDTDTFFKGLIEDNFPTIDAWIKQWSDDMVWFIDKAKELWNWLTGAANKKPILTTEEQRDLDRAEAIEKGELPDPNNSFRNFRNNKLYNTMPNFATTGSNGIHISISGNNFPQNMSMKNLETAMLNITKRALKKNRGR